MNFKEQVEAYVASGKKSPYPHHQAEVFRRDYCRNQERGVS